MANWSLTAPWAYEPLLHGLFNGGQGQFVQLGVELYFWLISSKSTAIRFSLSPCGAVICFFLRQSVPAMTESHYAHSHLRGVLTQIRQQVPQVRFHLVFWPISVFTNVLAACACACGPERCCCPDKRAILLCWRPDAACLFHLRFCKGKLVTRDAMYISLIKRSDSFSTVWLNLSAIPG